MAAPTNKSKQKRPDSATNISAPSKLRAEGADFDGDVKQAFSAIQQVLKYDIKSNDALVAEINTLRAEIQESRIESEKESLGSKHMMAKFTQETVQLESEKIALQKRLETREENFGAQVKARCQTAEKETQIARRALKETEQKLQIVKDKVKVLGTMYENSEAELHRLKDDIGLLEDDHDICRDLEKLEVELHNLAIKYCTIPLTDATQCCTLARSLHRSKFLDVIRNAVPISASKYSLLLRAATIEALVADRLAKILFRPLFPRSTPSEADPNEIEFLLGEIAQVNPRGEALIRAILTKTETRQSKADVKSEIDSMTTEIANICAPMLRFAGETGHNSFQEELEDFFDHALQVWSTTQRKEARIEASLMVNDAEMIENSRYHDQDSSDLNTEEYPYHIAVLFPRVLQTSAGLTSVVHAGKALCQHHVLYLEGQEEYLAQWKQISNQRSTILNSAGGRSRGNRSQNPRTPSNGSSNREARRASIPVNAPGNSIME